MEPTTQKCTRRPREASRLRATLTITRCSKTADGRRRLRWELRRCARRRSAGHDSVGRPTKRRHDWIALGAFTALGSARPEPPERQRRAFGHAAGRRNASHALARKTRQTRQQAADILDRIPTTLPMPASVYGYLHGYAASLRAR